MPTQTEPVLPDNRKSDKGLGGTVLAMKEQLAHGDARMGQIETDLRANTKTTNEIHEIVTMGRSFFRVLGWIGTGVKWLASTAAAVGSLWYIFTHGPQK